MHHNFHTYSELIVFKLFKIGLNLKNTLTKSDVNTVGVYYKLVRTNFKPHQVNDRRLQKRILT